jgi:uncharacterized membrane protein YesL
MDRFFDSENPVMRFLSRLVDLAVLNIVTVIYSLPLVTFGGAMAAMNYVLLHLVRGDETYVIRMFRKSFGDNFRQGVPEGLLVILIAVITAVDMWALHGSESRLLTVMMIIITIAAVFIFVTAVYMFALQSRYENTVKGTIVNAFRLSVGNLPSTAAMAAAWTAWAFVLVYLHKAAALAFLLYGFTLPGYICAMLMDRIFEKLEKEE